MYLFFITDYGDRLNKTPGNKMSDFIPQVSCALFRSLKKKFACPDCLYSTI